MRCISRIPSSCNPEPIKTYAWIARSSTFEPNGAGDSDLDAQLDEDFPLGDGTVETEATVLCPYCGEAVVIALDPGSGSVQEYVEDCEVCCQPWAVSVSYREGNADVSVRPLDT